MTKCWSGHWPTLPRTDLQRTDSTEVLGLDLALAYNNRGVAYSGLVETGESRPPSTDHSVSATLRDLSDSLARLADALYKLVDGCP